MAEPKQGADTPKNRGNAGKGRPKGSPNKTTALLKDAILMAAQECGSDGKGKEGMVGYLKQQAQENPGPFMSLLGKVLPIQVQGDSEKPIAHSVTVEIVRTAAPDS